jgi:hypothetical protein
MRIQLQPEFYQKTINRKLLQIYANKIQSKEKSMKRDSK